LQTENHQFDLEKLRGKYFPEEKIRKTRLRKFKYLCFCEGKKDGTTLRVKKWYSFEYKKLPA